MRTLLGLGCAAILVACSGAGSDDLFSSSGSSGSATTGVGGAGTSTGSVGTSSGNTTTSSGNAGGAGGTMSSTGSTSSSGGGTSTSSGQGGGMSTSSGQGGGASSSSTSTSSSSGQGGGPVDPVGCSDGTREYFGNAMVQPNIAGCSGGFDVPSVTSPESMVPACNRVSGNDSVNAQGSGCSVEDLCSEGWHVCHGAIDVAQSSSTGQCDPMLGVTPEFYITRQVQDNQGNCAAPPNTNNITGCGNMGGLPSVTCNPLNRRMRQVDCAPTLNWYCGNDNNALLIEATIVMKIGSGEGGVLCCKD